MLENWNGMDVFRDSFNHYSFGAVCQFLFEYVAGIRPTFEAAGFKNFVLKPVIGGSLTWAEATYRSVNGEIYSCWDKEGSIYRYRCSVPENSVARLVLPDGQTKCLNAGKYEFKGVINE